MSNRHLRAGDSIRHAPAAAAANGEVLTVGSLLGVACEAIAAGGSGTVAVAGAWRLPKADAAAIAQGDLLYADASEGNKLNREANAAAVAGDLERCAVALAAAKAGDDDVEALLLPGQGRVKA